MDFYFMRRRDLVWLAIHVVVLVLVVKVYGWVGLLYALVLALHVLNMAARHYVELSDLVGRVKAAKEKALREDFGRRL